MATAPWQSMVSSISGGNRGVGGLMDNPNWTPKNVADFTAIGYLPNEAAILANPASTNEQKMAVGQAAYARNPNKSQGAFGDFFQSLKEALPGTLAIAGAGAGALGLEGLLGGGAGVGAAGGFDTAGFEGLTAADLGLPADAALTGGSADTLLAGGAGADTLINPETIGSTTGGITASGSINPETFGAGTGFNDLVNTALPGATLANAAGVTDESLLTGSGIGSSASGFTGAGAGAGGAGVPAEPSAFSGVGDFLKSNKNLLIPGAALAASVLAKPKAPAAQGDLQNLAGVAGGAANSLIPTVSTGKLPEGAQNQVNTAVEDAKTSIRSKYANMGLTGSTMEAQDLAAADQRGEVMRFDMAKQLTQLGLDAAAVSSGDLRALMEIQLQQDSALQNALANFASSAALGAGLSDLAASRTPNA